MRRGLSSYRNSCCDGFGVWITSVDAPQPHPTEHVGEWDYSLVGGNAFLTPPGPYPLQSFSTGVNGTVTLTDAGDNHLDVTIAREVRPQIWAPEPQQFHMFIAKGPTSYPYGSCKKYPAISSAEDGGDGSWQADLGSVMEYEEYAVGDDTARDIRRRIGECYRIRAIYLDGEQKWLGCTLGGKFGNPVGSEENPTPGDSFAYATSGTGGFAPVGFGDIYIVDIATKTKLGEYACWSMNGNTRSNIGADPTTMEYAASRLRLPPTFPDGGEQYQGQANCLQLGEKYAYLTSYHLGTTTDAATSTTSLWAAARVKFQGTRLGLPGLEARCTPFVDGSPPDLGHPATVYAGDYVVLLPSIRDYRESAAEVDDVIDEGWVAAVKFGESNTLADPEKVVFTRCQSTVYRPGVDLGGESEEYRGWWDGTLDSSEVTLGNQPGNVLFDVDHPPEGVTAEEMKHFALYCYNRQWDFVDKACKNLAIYTIYNETATDTQSDVVADFEQPDGFVIDYLDNGLPDGVHFNTYGIGDESAKFEITNSGIFGASSPPGNAPISGSYQAQNNQSTTEEGSAVLELPFIAASSGTVTVSYRVANRVREEGSEDYLPNPVPENHAKFELNGVVLDIADMVSFPVDASGNEAAFETTYTYSFSVAAGANTIRIYSVRGTTSALEELVVQVDDITFSMPVVKGSGTNGRKIIWFDGTTPRLFTDFAYAKRDEGTATSLDSMGSIVPYFIEMDQDGKYLIGNPHYIVRMNRDGTRDETHGGSRGAGFPSHQTGWLRMTANPLVLPPDPPCFDPDDRLGVDLVADAPPGGYQILRTGGNGYQLRGANGSMADATCFPFDKKLYKYKHPITGRWLYEEFAERLRVTYAYTQRPNCFTVRDNGNYVEPHLDTLWRPSKHNPSWPEGESHWTNGPYMTGFGTNTENDNWPLRYSHRIRDPIQIPAESELPRWAMLNWVIPRQYTDAWSRLPQNVWVRLTGDPPNDSESSFYWNPDWEAGVVTVTQNPGEDGGPWNSAIWYLVPARWMPNGTMYWFYNKFTTIACSGHSGDPAVDSGPDVKVDTKIYRHDFGLNFYGINDFDVIFPSCSCGCCPPKKGGEKPEPTVTTLESVEQVLDFGASEFPTDTNAYTELTDDPAGYLKIVNTDHLEVLGDELTTADTFEFVLPPTDEIKRLAYLEIASARIKVHTFNMPVGSTHRVEVHLGSNIGEAVVTTDSTLMFSADLPVVTDSDYVVYDGSGRKFFKPRFQTDFPATYSIAIKYFVTLPDTIGDTNFEVRIDSITAKLYYKEKV